MTKLTPAQRRVVEAMMMDDQATIVVARQWGGSYRSTLMPENRRLDNSTVHVLRVLSVLSLQQIDEHGTITETCVYRLNRAVAERLLGAGR